MSLYIHSELRVSDTVAHTAVVNLGFKTVFRDAVKLGDMDDNATIRFFTNNAGPWIVDPPLPQDHLTTFRNANFSRIVLHFFPRD